MRYLLFAIFFLTAGCQQSGNSSKNMFRISIEAEPTTLDPRKARDLNTVTICRMLYEGLTRISKEGTIEFAVAKGVDVLEGGLKYVFHLKKTIWSNGSPLTSADFASSWKEILDPKFPSDVAYQLYVIKNAKKVKCGEMGMEKVGIETPDPFTLVVELEQPTPYFLELCSLSSWLPVPQKTAKDNPDWALEPLTFVGNGPFTLKNWHRGDSIQVTKNERYWEANRVQLAGVDIAIMLPNTELRMFEEGKLDWAGSPLSTIPADALPHYKEDRSLNISPFSGTCFLRVNTMPIVQGKANPLCNPNLRRALSLAINRQQIVEHLLQGGQRPAMCLVPKEMGLSEEGFFEDGASDKARVLLSSCTVNEPMTIVFAPSQRNMTVAQAIQKQWESALGLKVELKPLEYKVFLQTMKEKAYQLAIGTWTADFNDPINFLEVFKYSSASTNNTSWENPKYIDLLDRSAVCRNQDERRELLRKAEELLMDEMPILPIFHFSMNYLQGDGVQDVALSPIGLIDFRWAHLDKIR